MSVGFSWTDRIKRAGDRRKEGGMWLVQNLRNQHRLSGFPGTGVLGGVSGKEPRMWVEAEATCVKSCPARDRHVHNRVLYKALMK